MDYRHRNKIRKSMALHLVVSWTDKLPEMKPRIFGRIFLHRRRDNLFLTCAFFGECSLSCVRLRKSAESFKLGTKTIFEPAEKHKLPMLIARDRLVPSATHSCNNRIRNGPQRDPELPFEKKRYATIQTDPDYHCFESSNIDSKCHQMKSVAK